MPFPNAGLMAMRKFALGLQKRVSKILLEKWNEDGADGIETSRYGASLILQYEYGSMHEESD